VILDALELAKLSSVRLIVLGPLSDLRYARRLREQAATIPGVQIQLYGGYEPAELPHLLADVDCLIAPSQWPETFLLVAREALIRGIPVVVTRLGALPDSVIEGKNGFTFNYDHPEELAAILRKLVEDEELLLQLREGARRTEVMTVQRHAEAVRSLYQEAVTERVRNGVDFSGDGAEAEFLHQSLLSLAFGNRT
jgi:glycosyltransferase involved in cell wall biosynthesis